MDCQNPSQGSSASSGDKQNNNTNNIARSHKRYGHCLALFLVLATFGAHQNYKEKTEIISVIGSSNVKPGTTLRVPHIAIDKSTHEVDTSDSSTNELPSGFPNAQYRIDPSKHYDLCTVGAGLSGTVFAERAANLLNQTVLVIDSRSHIGGNCYDFVDQKTGILRNQYGSHLFHTNLEHVWKYVNSIRNTPEWSPWYHQKVGYVNGSYIPIPVNILTVNTLFNLHIRNETQMQAWLKTVQVPCPKSGCRNGEEMAKSRVGEALYKAIFETYTIKQWGKSPKEMDISVTARIPVRSNFDPRYFSDTYQAFPSEGYTAWFAAALDHPNIDVALKVDFFERKSQLGAQCGKIVYTGPIDRYFADTGMQKLEYRSITFHEERHYNHPGYILPTPVVNYPGPETPFTRAVEYKQYLHRSSPHSIVVKETSSDTGEPYYPVPTKRNMELYDKYKTLADDLEKSGKIMFVGRLANYKYFNMDQAISNALNLFYQSHWTRLFQGEHFQAYKASIDEKMRKLRESRLPRAGNCVTAVPAYHGEFGTELRVMVPWAYAAHESNKDNCLVQTTSVRGSKYMYFFADNHTIVDSQRDPQHLPAGNPFRNKNPHVKDFPYDDTKWLAPPFKEFFNRQDVRSKLAKPLLVLSNKYTMEWQKDPVNFMSKDMLRELLAYLTPNYTIVYKRHTDKRLRDGDGVERDLHEKQMIRTEYPSVILFEDLASDSALDADDQNLLLFGLLASSDQFVSVQGGMAVVSSYFGGTTVILVKAGNEVKHGDYNYFHRFSNATVVWETKEKSFLKSVQKRL